jgi:hypothetical protein
MTPQQHDPNGPFPWPDRPSCDAFFMERPCDAHGEHIYITSEGIQRRLCGFHLGVERWLKAIDRKSAQPEQEAS